jgi:hypothetical protein
VILKTADAIPANYLSNSFAFHGSDPASDTTAITAALDAFYTSIASNIWGAQMASVGHEIKYTNLPGTPPNYPFLQTSFDTGAVPGGEPLPSEVALCLSFQGSKAAGFPQARRRGRIYVGTVKSTLLDSGRPIAAARTNLAAYAATFKAAIQAISSDTVWAVWSHLDGVGVEITNGWVDNVWDTQRRRGLGSTARTLFT